MAHLPTPITFMAALQSGGQKQTEAYPVGVTVGNVKHQFALHQLPDNSWRVSCPKSGRRVMDLVAYLKGMPVHSGCLTAQEAMATCRAQVQAFAVRVGGDEAFNRVVLQTIQQAEGVAAC